MYGRPPLRLAWVDATKGLAISLVVFGHVLGGMLARGWLQDPLGRAVYDYIYLFHMPAFFMISGMFFCEQARSRPLDTLKSRLGAIAWPYFFWDVAIRFSLLPLISGFMGSPAHLSLAEWIRRALTGDLSWFLWTLLVMQIILIPLLKINIIMLLTASVSVSMLLPGGDSSAAAAVIQYMPYLLFGGLLRSRLHYFGVFSEIWQAATAAVALFATMALLLHFGLTTWAPVRMACGIAGSLACIFIVRCTEGSPQTPLMVQLGLASLAIYVLHPYFQGAARAVVLGITGPAPMWQLTLPTLAAIIGPYLVWLLAERTGCSWLFRLRFRRLVPRDADVG